jgi:Ca-activated chloride channel family protein
MMAARSPGRRLIKAVILGVGLGLVLAAAARPQLTGTSVSKRKGMDLVIALDVSKSMLVGDVEVGEPQDHWPSDLEPDAVRALPENPAWVQGTRLERARQAMTSLVDQLPDDRISIVMFAGASIHFPLTDDEHLAAQFMHMIGPADLTGGSDIGEALRVAKCLLRPEVKSAQVGCAGIGERGHGGDPLPGEERRGRRRVTEKATEERGKALIVVTDGGASAQSVITEADLAKRLGVSLFFVGIGSDQGGTVPEIDSTGAVIGPKKDAQGNVVKSKLDRASLQQLALLAGGEDHYAELGPTGMYDLTPIVAQLSSVQRGELERTETDKKRDIYHWLLFPGFMLLLVEAAIGLRKRIKHPETLP